jgi:sugar-phosphatase
MVRAEGLVLGLATSSAPPLIDAVLTKLGLMDAFAVMHSAIEEELGKPHPAVFLTTAQLLDVEPAECVAIEDSVAGVRSAVAAGMRVIAVPPPHLFDEPGYDDADLKLESLEELTPEMLG